MRSKWCVLVGVFRVFMFVGVVVLSSCTTGGDTLAENNVGHEPLVSLSGDNLLSKPTRLIVPDDADYGGVLRRAMHAQISDLRWYGSNSSALSEIEHYVKGGLTRLEVRDSYRYVPDVAERATVSADGTVYTVRLKQGVFWHLSRESEDEPELDWTQSPRELTAEDAVFYYEMMGHPDVPSGAIKSYLKDIVRVEALDRYTFQVEWSHRLHHAKVTVLMAQVVPRWLYSRERDGSPIPEDEVARRFYEHWASQYFPGVGAYRVVEFRPNSLLRMERNDNYVGERPPIERLEWKWYRSEVAAVEAVTQGDADVADVTGRAPVSTVLSRDSVRNLFEVGRMRDASFDRLAYYYIGWSLDRPQLQDRRVRQALAYAFDREEVGAKYYEDDMILQPGPYFYKHPGHAPDVEPIEFDLSKASQLLDEAGWMDRDGDGIREKEINGEVLELTLEAVHFNGRAWLEIMDTYRENLFQVGVRMEGVPLSWPNLLRRMESGEFDAFTGGWGLAWEVDLYQIWHSSQADVENGSNRVGFRHEEADRVIERLRITVNEDERISLLREFHRIVYWEQPYLFLFGLRGYAIWNARVKNVSFQAVRPHVSTLGWYLSDGRDAQ
ncbi:ABC transporter substrate-binding protein [Lujinxingia vulgaris]|nr:ABC transporter substrate-binding protein [Lujinxingia vulgaris]